MSKQELTKEQILAMKPGREMNRLIAETVLRTGNTSSPVDFSEKDWFDYHHDIIGVFHYSSNISDVWQVEEQIKKVSLTVEYTGALKQVVLSSGEYVGMFDFIHATPEQRCKAALLAVIGGSSNEQTRETYISR